MMLLTAIERKIVHPEALDPDWGQEVERLEALIARTKQGETLPPGLLISVLEDVIEVLDDEEAASLALIQTVADLTADAGPVLRSLRCEMLCRQAAFQADLGQDAAALRTHQSIIAEFEADRDVEYCVKVVESQFAVAEAFQRQETKPKAEIALYDAIIARHDGTKHAPLRDLVVRAKMLRALRMPGGGRDQIHQLEAFLAQFCRHKSAGIVAVVAECFIALADLVTAQSGPAAAQEVRNRMLAWAADPDLHVQNDPISTILLSKFSTAADLGDWASARDAAQAILDRGAQACMPVYQLLDQVFDRDRAAVLAGTGGDAVAVLADLAPGRRDPDECPFLQTVRARQADLLRDDGQTHAALAQYEEAIRLGADDHHDRARSVRANLHLQASMLCDILEDRVTELAHYDAVLADWRDDDNPELVDYRLVALLSKRVVLVGQEDYVGADQAGQLMLDHADRIVNLERRWQVASVQCHRIALAQYFGGSEQAYQLRIGFLEKFYRDHELRVLALVLPEALLALRAAMVKGQRHVVMDICWALWDLADHVDDPTILVQICRAALESGLYLQNLEAFEEASEQLFGVCEGFGHCRQDHPDYPALLDLAQVHLAQCQAGHKAPPQAAPKPSVIDRLSQSVRDLFGRDSDR